MASVNITLNGLTVILSGVSGYIDQLVYTNNDPVDYIFQMEHKGGGSNGFTANYRLRSGQQNKVLEEFIRSKTDEIATKFLGAILPSQ